MDLKNFEKPEYFVNRELSSLPPGQYRLPFLLLWHWTVQHLQSQGIFRQGLTWQIQRKDGFWYLVRKKEWQSFSHLPHGCTLLDFLQCGQPDPELL